MASTCDLKGTKIGETAQCDAWASEENGLVEAGGDLEDWRADHRVLVQQGQVVGATTNGGEASE